ncbi:hypothetical protein D3C86_1882380 [compost metagenome]
MSAVEEVRLRCLHIPSCWPSFGAASFQRHRVLNGLSCQSVAASIKARARPTDRRGRGDDQARFGARIRTGDRMGAGKIRCGLGGRDRRRVCASASDLLSRHAKRKPRRLCLS